MKAGALVLLALGCTSVLACTAIIGARTIFLTDAGTDARGGPGPDGDGGDAGSEMDASADGSDPGSDADPCDDVGVNVATVACGATARASSASPSSGAANVLDDNSTFWMAAADACPGGICADGGVELLVDFGRRRRIAKVALLAGSLSLPNQIVRSRVFLVDENNVPASNITEQNHGAGGLTVFPLATGRGVKIVVLSTGGGPPSLRQVTAQR